MSELPNQIPESFNTLFNGFYFKVIYESASHTLWNIDMWLLQIKRQDPISHDLVDGINNSLISE